MLRPSLLLLFSAGCIGGDPGSLASNDAEANAPAVALGASGELLDYGETDGSCFRVPGVARGTGFAQHPELALGVVWTMEAECDDCMWGASSDLYLGAGLSEETGAVDVFDGIVAFDDSSSSRALSEIFGVQVAPGSLAEVTATRTYTGTVDYRDPDVQAAIAAWAGEPSDRLRGFGWNVTRFAWSASFLISDEFYDPDADLVEVDGQPYERTGNTLVGYEVFVCLLSL
jgi:hypothetical protein